MSGPQSSEFRCFNENSPRPPVPGEERERLNLRCRATSPELQPRRSTLTKSQKSLQTYCDASAPLGFEPEGRCDNSNVMESSADSLKCLQWSRSLHDLLEDRNGLELFDKFLEQEGQCDILSFWFACEGLKEERDPNKLHTVAKAFFKRYKLALTEDERRELRSNLREGFTDKRIFESAQQRVERLLAETSYPNFLHSDMYLHYVHKCQTNRHISEQGRSEDEEDSKKYGRSTSPNEPELDLGYSKGSILPTLHEDSEFVAAGSPHSHTSSTYHQGYHNQNHQGDFSKGEVRLTKDVLMATQQFRAQEVRPKQKAFAGVYLQTTGTSPYHTTIARPRPQNSSYNPVSRQDSELQSLSSDARTESDNLSLTDGSLDGLSLKKNNKRQYIRHCRQMKQSALINRDPIAHETIIPRTQRVSKEQTQSWVPQEFAKLLIEKLDKVKQDQDNEEKFQKKIKELQLDDDNDQDILDQHVSRVWADRTPSRSPKLSSPRPLSPDKRRVSSQQQRADFTYQRALYRQKKEKDVFSTFSGDSGNVHDFPESNNLVGAGSVSSLGSLVTKSVSMPSDYSDSMLKQDIYLQEQDQRYQSSRSSTKKSMTELTDSGVSVVSDVVIKDVRLMNWLKESDHKKNDVKHSRHLKKYASHSSNLERAKQPFIADPGMPPLPQPHTPTQLEEAKRRLILQEEERLRSRQRHLNNCKQVGYELMPSVQSSISSSESTLRRCRQDTFNEFTTVVFSFCDEQVPYRTKIPGHNVTLRQFKEFLPKKGNYRYFFKTECEDPDMKVIQEEITDDTEILPLWDGKVMAQVKALE